MKIKKDDLVIVTTGKDKGKEGKVIATDSENNKVKVEGVKIVTKFTKKSIQGPGSMTKQEAWIDASNVSLKDPKTKKATRVGYQFDKNGKKQRVAAKSKEVISKS